MKARPPRGLTRCSGREAAGPPSLGRPVFRSRTTEIGRCPLAWRREGTYSRRVPGEGLAGVLFDLPAVTQGDYEALIQALEVGSTPPEGALLHLAGPHPDGGWLILDVWESVEAFESFASERLLPAARALGISPVRPRVFPVHDLLARSGQTSEAELGTDLAEDVIALARRRAAPRDREP
jgi:hypothetical protein